MMGDRSNRAKSTFSTKGHGLFPNDDHNHNGLRRRYEGGRDRVVACLKGRLRKMVKIAAETATMQLNDIFVRAELQMSAAKRRDVCRACRVWGGAWKLLNGPPNQFCCGQPPSLKLVRKVSIVQCNSRQAVRRTYVCWVLVSLDPKIEVASGAARPLVLNWGPSQQGLRRRRQSVARGL
jgi:hypothetical protein